MALLNFKKAIWSARKRKTATYWSKKVFKPAPLFQYVAFFYRCPLWRFTASGGGIFIYRRKK